jgi:hypothetical protein
MSQRMQASVRYSDTVLMTRVVVVGGSAQAQEEARAAACAASAMEALAAEAAAAQAQEAETTTSYATRALNTLSNPSSSRAQRKREPKGEREEGVCELEQLKPLFRYTVSLPVLSALLPTHLRQVQSCPLVSTSQAQG